jgi:hypothetical protein
MPDPEKVKQLMGKKGTRHTLTHARNIEPFYLTPIVL